MCNMLLTSFIWGADDRGCSRRSRSRSRSYLYHNRIQQSNCMAEVSRRVFLVLTCFAIYPGVPTGACTRHSVVICTSSTIHAISWAIMRACMANAGTGWLEWLDNQPRSSTMEGTAYPFHISFLPNRQGICKTRRYQLSHRCCNLKLNMIAHLEMNQNSECMKNTLPSTAYTCVKHSWTEHDDESEQPAHLSNMPLTSKHFQSA